MDNGGDMLQLCRLCLVKEDVNIPIFEEQGDSGQIYVKISSCLPVKVQRNDNLPQNICDSCFNKLDVVYDLWTTSTNSEKQLHTWLKATETANNELIQQKRLTKATNKTSDAIVKQEAVEDSFVQEVTWDEASSSAGPSVTVVSQEEPPPKRARRAAAVKASITVAAESDDDDETEPMTKMEEDSEDEDDPDATFGEVPSTSADDQPGPSGVGKDGSEAPESNNSEDTSSKCDVLDFDAFGLTCEICNKSFYSNVDFALHSIEHTDFVSTTSNKKYYYCHFCPYKTLTEKNIKKHLLRHDGKLKLFDCEICGRSYKEIYQAVEHKFFHTNEAQYSCSICNKEFVFSWLHKSHLRIMHGKIIPRKRKPTKFNCAECGIQYKTGQGLRRHNLRNHNTEIRTYLCDVCGKSLANTDSLKFHKRAHIGYKPHACTVCPKSFTKKEQLKEHFRIHSGEKPFICDYCGKGFTQRGPLKIHQRTHTGERPYICRICGKGCICKSALDSHLKTCSGGVIKIESVIMSPDNEYIEFNVY